MAVTKTNIRGFSNELVLNMKKDIAKHPKKWSKTTRHAVYGEIKRRKELGRMR